MKIIKKASSGCKVLFISSLFLSINNIGKAQKVGTDYIKKHSIQAMNLMSQTGIPASVILGVAMEESGLGRSKNSKLLKKHFGIIGKNDLDGSYHSRFKAFDNAEESFAYFAKLVTSKKFYENLKGSLNFSSWISHLNKAGYCATNPDTWISHIHYMIEHYKLTRFDKLVATTKESPVNFFAAINDF